MIVISESNNVTVHAVCRILSVTTDETYTYRGQRGHHTGRRGHQFK